MLKGMFRSVEDSQVLADLKSVPAFRAYVDKLRQAHIDATADMMYADSSQLQAKQGYARCLHELIQELSK